MLKRLGSGLVALILVLGLLPVTVSANTVGVSLSSNKTTVASGQTFTVSVNLGQSSDVFGTSVDITYDPSQVELVQATPGSLVQGNLTTSQIFTSTFSRDLPDGNKRATAIAVRLGNQLGVTSAGLIGTFEFTAKSTAATSISFDGSNVEVQAVNSSGQLIPLGTPSGLVIGHSVVPVITGSVGPRYSRVTNVEVVGTAAPNAGLTLLVDGVIAESGSATASGSFSFPIVLTAGSHEVKVKDNETGAHSAPATIIVDTQAPALHVNEIMPSVNTTVSGSVNDQNLSALYIQVNQTGGPSDADLVPVSNGSYSKPITLVQSDNSIVVTAKDHAGNTTVVTRTVRPLTKPLLTLVPSQTVVGVDGTFTVDVKLATPVPVKGADVQIKFPTNLLQVVDSDASTAGLQVTSGTFLTGLGSTNSADNAAGTVRWALASGTAVTGSGTIASITFKATSVGQADVSFKFDSVNNTWLTDVLDANLNLIAHDVQNTTVAVLNGGSITGQVKRLGQGTAISGVTVKVVGHPISTTTAADGTFTLTGVPAGTAQIIVKHPKFLAYVSPGQQVTAGGTVNLGSVDLKGGDANGDNKINLIDLGILATSYGLSQGQTTYDARADFNLDNKVNLVDLGTLATNYGQSGSPIPAGE